MDRIEQVAGVKLRTLKTAIGAIIGDDRVDCRFRIGNGQAELGVRAAGEAVKAVDRLQQALLGRRVTPETGSSVRIHHQPAK
ncbi:hypothetical protein D3C80_2137400 [compost metagenome]